MKTTSIPRLVGLVGLVGLLGLTGCRGDEGRCEDLCETVDDCEGADLDIDDCVEACVDDAEKAGDNCYETFEALADCVSENDLDCDELSGDGECEDDADDFEDDCDDDFEDTLEEIGGDDPPTCGGSETCSDAYDGICDEPEGTGICAEGTDTTDCCF